MKYIVFCSLIVFLLSCTTGKEDCKKECDNIVAEKEQAPLFQKITFPSLDSLQVTANLYSVSDSAPVIVLCHQARYNKFEYSGIAKSLQAKGFNCLAIDQRSGGGLVEEFNETNLAALKKNLPVDFLDAKKDIEAAVDFASKKYKSKIILWGSSYSSALALHIACENENVKAVICFSPGDYFDKELGSVIKKMSTCTKPMFITSSREEAPEISKMLFPAKLKKGQIQFVPDSAGFHGSRALWKTSANNEEYWKAINIFLSDLK
ncbi:MAG TPA: alpha/beta hydrolase [Bacteroidia bacterium]|nr:alpha/beta hydrolase [Bacteroidia bacterium]